MWINYNANPEKKRTGDCVIRALAFVLGKTWEAVYTDLYVQGLEMKEMPSANNVWGAYLRKQGYKREGIPNTCPDCYTVADFCKDHPEGKYILCLPSHVIGIEDGDWYDTFDTSSEVPIYYWEESK
jgi:hypothetical protein